MGYKYYFFYLELALRREDDLNIYSFINVSHIPTNKLIEIFNIDLNSDPYLTEGYFLTEKMVATHKDYISKNIGQINLDVFEYCLRQYASDNFNDIRMLYKEELME